MSPFSWKELSKPCSSRNSNLRRLRYCWALGLAGYGGGARWCLPREGAQEGQTPTVVAQGTKEDAKVEKKKETPIVDPATTEKKVTADLNETYAHRCVYIRAGDAESTLRNFFRHDPSIKPGQPFSLEWITSDDRTNTVFATATPDKIAQVKRILTKLDVGNVPYKLRFPRKSPKNLDEVAWEAKTARQSVAWKEMRWEMVPEPREMPNYDRIGDG